MDYRLIKIEIKSKKYILIEKKQDKIEEKQDKSPNLKELIEKLKKLKKDDKKKFSDTLFKIMKELKETQISLAKKINPKKRSFNQQIHNWVHGKSMPNTSSKKILIDYLEKNTFS